MDGAKIQQVLKLVEAGKLDEAARLLAPMVGKKRLVRGGRATPELEEIDEVKEWLRTVVADPDATDARFLVERTYYKLRSQLPPPERSARKPGKT
ncbi:MAG: hypothetical protein H0W82_00860 [Actinobacteria bacterium]|nr:hypothetical protein [Actinomycetota bacterium]